MVLVGYRDSHHGTHGVNVDVHQPEQKQANRLDKAEEVVKVGIFGRKKITADTSVVAWGSLGKGLKQAFSNGCQFLAELRQTGIRFSPPHLMSPETVARKKNSLSIREFRASYQEISKLLKDFVLGSIHCTNAFALSGGTGIFGILSQPIICEAAEYATAQLYLSQDLFSSNLANDERSRKLINTKLQLAVLGKVLKNSNCAVEIISMPSCIQAFGNSYELIDAGILECMSIFNGASSFNSHFDLEDILSDIRFQARTFGIRKMPIQKRYESNVTRIFNGISQLTPLFDPKYFTKSACSDVIGPPFIILVGCPELVDDAQHRFGTHYDQASSLEEMEGTLGSASTATLSPTLISFPIEGLSHIYILGIYPVNFDWLKDQCQAAGNWILDLNRSVARGQVNSMLTRVYRSMLAQVGNPEIEEFIGG